MDRETAWSGVPFEWKANGAVQLTTPVAYLTSLLKDPFTGAQANNVTGGLADGYRIGSGTWSYRVSEGGLPDNQGAAGVFDTNGKSMCFVTLSPGPDKKRERIGYKAFPYKGTGTEIAPVYRLRPDERDYLRRRHLPLRRLLPAGQLGPASPPTRDRAARKQTDPASPLTAPDNASAPRFGGGALVFPDDSCRGWPTRPGRSRLPASG
jgi:hypothetical protein